MAIRVYDDKPSTDLIVRAFCVGDVVTLEAVDENGNKRVGGGIISLSLSVGIHLYHSVNPSLGLPLDELGRVMLSAD